MLIAIVIIIIISVFCIVFKVQIDFKSLFRPGKHLKNSQYGLRDVSAPQGGGKTAFCIHKLYQYQNDYILFANVKDIKGLKYTYFEGFKGLYDIVGIIDSYNDKNLSTGLKTTKKQYCILYDELFTELTKHTKEISNLLKVLCQLRKRHIILLTTCQSFPELPLWFRRLCRYEISIRHIPLVTGSYFIATYMNGYKIKWDEIEQEFVAPTVVTKIEKVNRKIVNSYSTDEVISANKLNTTNGATHIAPFSRDISDDVVLPMLDIELSKDHHSETPLLRL